MLNRALLVVLLLVSTGCVAAPLVPTGSSATVTPVPNVAFGTTLLADSAVHASQALAVSNAKAQPAPTLTPKAPASTTLEHKTADKAEPNEYMPLWSGRSVKITDFLLILFTAALAVFTFLLWLSTRALFKETQRSGKTAEISANAAEKSALAAETSANVSRISVEAAIAAQQPRWLVKDMHVYSRSDYPRPTTSRRIVVTLVNHGTSAAEIIRKELRYVLVDAPTVLVCTES